MKTKLKKEIERPLIYFVDKEVKTVCLLPVTPTLVLYGCSDGSLYIDNLHSKGHLITLNHMKNSIVHTVILKDPNTFNYFMIIIQDRMGVISVVLLKVNERELKAEYLSEFNTKVWTFTRMSVFYEKSFDEALIAMPSLSSEIDVYSIKGVIKQTYVAKKNIESNIASALLFLGLHLINSYEDGTIVVWSVKENNMEATFKLLKEMGNIITLEGITYPTYYQIYVGAYNQSISILHYTPNTKLLQQIFLLTNVCCGEKPGISDIKLREDLKLFFTAGYDYRVRCYSTRSNKLIAVLKYHSKTVNQICLLGNKVIACSDDGYITEWEAY